VAMARTVNAALLVDINREVPDEHLPDRVWGRRAPQPAQTTLPTYVSRLRQVLDLRMTNRT
jgi:hypothetical protein